MILKLFLILTLISSNLATGISYDEFGLTKLHDAILQGQPEIIIKIIKEDIKGDKSLINAPDLASNSTPLHLLVDKVAVQKGSDQIKTIQLIKILVNNKVDRTIQTDSGWTALNKAFYLASDLVDYPIEVAEILLENCVAVDKITNNQTVLHYAAGSRLEPDRASVLVNLLMKHCSSNLNYNAIDSNQWTPLKVAVAAGNNDVVSILKPKTSSISLVMKIILGVVAVTIILIGFGIYYFYKISKNSEIEAEAKATADNDSGINDALSEKFKSSPKISFEIDSTTFGSKEKIN